MLDKEIRARIALPYPSAPYIRGEEENVTERGFLVLAPHPSKDFDEIYEDEAWPESLTLQCSLSALPFEKASIQVGLTLANHPLLSQPFYDIETLLPGSQALGEDSGYQAIQIHYENFGSYTKEGHTSPFQGEVSKEFKLALGADNVIYRKEFKYQSLGSLHQQEFPHGDFWLTVAPNGLAGERLYPLLAYGGFFKPGVDLTRIEPVFALIKQGENEQTALQLLKISDLRRMDIQPPRTQREGGEEWIFCDPIKPEDTLSLAGSLIAGAARIKVWDAEELDSRWYTSVSYEQPDPEAPLITLSFKPL